MEEIFFSGTFGGELLSLAAAKVVLKKQISGDVCEQLARIGEDLRQKLEDIIKKNALSSILSLSGHPSWVFLNWKPTSTYSVEALKTYFMQEMFKRGILVLNTHNVTLAMDKDISDEVLMKYDAVLELLAKRISENTLIENLSAKPLNPLFKIR